MNSHRYFVLILCKKAAFCKANSYAQLPELLILYFINFRGFIIIFVLFEKNLIIINLGYGFKESEKQIISHAFHKDFNILISTLIKYIAIAFVLQFLINFDNLFRIYFIEFSKLMKASVQYKF